MGVRAVNVSNIMSLDGFYEGPDRNVMTLNMDEAFDDYNPERIRSAGTVLLGRRSYEWFSSYWPGIVDAADDPGNRALSAGNRGLLGQALVDALHLMVDPVAFGDGTPIFTARAGLTLIDTRRFDGSDNVLLRCSAAR